MKRCGPLHYSGAWKLPAWAQNADQCALQYPGLCLAFPVAVMLASGSGAGQQCGESMDPSGC